jgi:hypothetical protein
MSVKEPLSYSSFTFHLNKVELRIDKIRKCVCLWENKETKKSILNISLELIRADNYGFRGHVMAPRTITSVSSIP